jgi:hypothetical protein
MVLSSNSSSNIPRGCGESSYAEVCTLDGPDGLHCNQGLLRDTSLYSKQIFGKPSRRTISRAEVDKNGYCEHQSG